MNAVTLTRSLAAPSDCVWAIIVIEARTRTLP
jgi:hypothetical protein